MHRLGRVALVMMSLATASGTNANDVFPYAVDVRDFPNGLKLVGVRFDSPGLAAYYTVVRVGARQEVDRARAASPTSSST